MRRARGYRAKIDPITIVVSSEGTVDERIYFEAIEKKIPKRFKNIVKFVPLLPENKGRAPKYVYGDLLNYLNENNLKPHKESVEAFLIIDYDHFFQNRHQNDSRWVIAESLRKKINVICTTPAFDFWLLLHTIDVAEASEYYKNKVLNNIKVSSNKTFLKSEVSKQQNALEIYCYLPLTTQALNNEKKLVKKDACFPSEDISSSMNILFDFIKDKNELLFKEIIR
jgi:hypothetical protein